METIRVLERFGDAARNRGRERRERVACDAKQLVRGGAGDDRLERGRQCCRPVIHAANEYFGRA
jgi:hypothetical protein